MEHERRWGRGGGHNKSLRTLEGVQARQKPNAGAYTVVSPDRCCFDGVADSSIALRAVVDARGRFTLVGMGEKRGLGEREVE